MTRSAQHNDDWLPPTIHTAQGHIRQVGVEIEFAGISPDTVAQCIKALYGGDIHMLTQLEYLIKNSEYGDFRLELDAAYLKARSEQQLNENVNEQGFSATMLELVTRAAEQLVPWEVVSPPIKMTELHRLDRLTSEMRELGAQGTRHAFQYAFGLHLNPELPDLDTQTILRYLRAYLCLYDWIAYREQVDTTRRLTPYITHFDKAYMQQVLDPDYCPSREELIDDYLTFNPTRNRSLDLLPLFAYLDEGRVKDAVHDPRITPRPTFHYRLPNCDIDNPEWNLLCPWSLWLEVENLANQGEKLALLCDDYYQELARLTHPFEQRWVNRVDYLVAEELH